jgi:hypothetical protein
MLSFHPETFKVEHCPELAIEKKAPGGRSSVQMYRAQSYLLFYIFTS